MEHAYLEALMSLKEEQHFTALATDDVCVSAATLYSAWMVGETHPAKIQSCLTRRDRQQWVDDG